MQVLIDNFDDIFKEIYKIVEEKFKNSSSCHDFDHTLRVLNNAIILNNALPNAHSQIVQTAAILHDIARAKELKEQGECCHAILGAELIPELLSHLELPQSFVDAVANAVRTHRYRSNNRPTTLEGAIVFDADKLDSLGAIGIGRSFLFAGKIQARLHNSATVALAADEYSREDTAYREYLVKLRHLPSQMITAPGKKLAEKRANFMDNFFATLNEEINSCLIS